MGAAFSARTGAPGALLIRIANAKVTGGAPLASVGVEANDATVMHRESNARRQSVSKRGGGGVAEEKQEEVLVSENEQAPSESKLFFPVEKISIRPYPIDILDGVGPPDVDPSEMHGRSILKVWINETGEVVETDVLFSDMPSSFLVAAVSAFKRMRFMPGWLDGKRVGSVMTIEINAEDFALPVLQ